MMTDTHTTHATQKRGFTSISRLILKSHTEPPGSGGNNNYLMHQRHRYLLAGEAILLGILSAAFLLAIVASEFTARSDSLILLISIPFVTFFALHPLCLVASQLAHIAKPFLRKRQLWCQDIAQGVTIITIFTIYAVLRIVHPIADWFTPIAWIWIGIWAADCLGRTIEAITPKAPRS